MLLVTTLYLLSCLSCNHARSDGSPLSVCNTMKPAHSSNVPQSLDHSPYDVTATVDQDGKVTAMINSRTGEQFKGILLEARVSPDQNAEGTWEISERNGNFKLIACNNQVDSAVTHTNSRLKSLPASFVWSPTSMQSPLNYTIYATVLANYSTYYVMISSNITSSSGGSGNLNTSGMIFIVMLLISFGLYHTEF